MELRESFQKWFATAFLEALSEWTDSTTGTEWEEHPGLLDKLLDEGVLERSDAHPYPAGFPKEKGDTYLLFTEAFKRELTSAVFEHLFGEESEEEPANVVHLTKNPFPSLGFIKAACELAKKRVEDNLRAKQIVVPDFRAKRVWFGFMYQDDALFIVPEIVETKQGGIIHLDQDGDEDEFKQVIQ